MMEKKMETTTFQAGFYIYIYATALQEAPMCCVPQPLPGASQQPMLGHSDWGKSPNGGCSKGPCKGGTIGNTLPGKGILTKQGI